MQQRKRHNTVYAVHIGQPIRVGVQSEPRLHRSEAMRALGPVVYAVRVADGVIKIGFTVNLQRRYLTVGAEEILAFRLGTLEDEQAIHAQLVAHRHHGREWYHPTPEVLSLVNDMRDELGLDPVAA